MSAVSELKYHPFRAPSQIAYLFLANRAGAPRSHAPHMNNNRDLRAVRRENVRSIGERAAGGGVRYRARYLVRVYANPEIITRVRDSPHTVLLPRI